MKEEPTCLLSTPGCCFDYFSVQTLGFCVSACQLLALSTQGTALELRWSKSCSFWDKSKVLICTAKNPVPSFRLVGSVSVDFCRTVLKYFYFALIAFPQLTWVTPLDADVRALYFFSFLVPYLGDLSNRAVCLIHNYSVFVRLRYVHS